jgi:molecular chaperone DnaK
MGTDKVYGKAGDTAITPEWLSAQQLAYVAKSVDEFFGNRDKRSCVISVPADFKEDRRQSTVRAGQQAGFEVIGIVNEPTSAFLAYGLSHQEGDQVIEVIDVGGGTTDVTIGSKQGSDFNVLASRGDQRLGGGDVDEILMAWACDAFKKQTGVDLTKESHPMEYFTAKEEIRHAKHALFAKQETKIAIRVDKDSMQLTLTRDKLADLIKPLLKKLEDLMLAAEADAKVKREELKVLPVGGSWRLIAVREMVKRIYGEDRIVGGKTSPDQAVVLGSAIHAAKLASSLGKVLVDERLHAIPAPAIKHCDVTAHGLGVSVSKPGKQERFMSEILARNTPLPCTATKAYGSVEDNQTLFSIEVLEGREVQPVSECLVVASKELTFPARGSSNPSIDVTMSYDTNGMCRVVVFDRVSKRSEEITINFSEKGKI